MSGRWRPLPCESLVVDVPLESRRQLRRYNIKVVPDVWPSKTTRFARKAAIRAAEDLVTETREGFWKQRAKRFHVDAHFPALVTRQLLPVWDSISPDDEDEDARQPPPDYFGFSQTLLKSTASCDAKFQKKDQMDEEKHRLPWMAIGTAGVSDLLCRGPVLHRGSDAGKPRQSDQQLVVKEPLLPVGRASMVQRSAYTDLAGSGCSPANCESRRQEILESKLRGQVSRKQLERRYASRRKDFRRKKDMASTTLSGWRTVGSFRPTRSFNPQISTGSGSGNLLKDLQDLHLELSFQ